MTGHSISKTSLIQTDIVFVMGGLSPAFNMVGTESYTQPTQLAEDIYKMLAESQMSKGSKQIQEHSNCTQHVQHPPQRQATTETFTLK